MVGQGFRWIASRFLGLPKATTRYKVHKAAPIAMRDGVELLADLYLAPDAAKRPTALMRSPYGRGTLMAFTASLLAERGLNVVVQSVRGTSGSGGDFDPIRQERADGVDTVEWVRAQPWFGGKLFPFGGSYLGTVIWAMACDAAEMIDGASLLMTLSHFRDELLEFGGLAQGTMLGWSQMMLSLVGPNAGAIPSGKPIPGAVHQHLPLGTIDQAATGRKIPWWRDWVNHSDPRDEWWRAMDFSAGVTALRAPTNLIAGWQDLFLPHQLKDFEARQAAGLNTWLTIGPWSHGGPSGLFEGQRQSVSYLLALAGGRDPFPNRDRVRVFVQGAGEWRDYPSWPPPKATPLRLHLHADGVLAPSAPTQDEGSSRYVYDPADPTPSIYGAALGGVGKSRDMSPLERRSDSLSFTSAPLDDDLEVIGPLSVELSVRSDREHTDFYACLCEVDRRGRPLHVSDGYIRLRPETSAADAAGVRRITIECWPTAYRFRRGAKLRLIVASGAFPRYARNLGTGEPLATATRMVPAQQEILHDAQYGSSVSLLRA